MYEIQKSYHNATSKSWCSAQRSCLRTQLEIRAYQRRELFGRHQYCTQAPNIIICYSLNTFTTGKSYYQFTKREIGEDEII